jgi:thiol-disulfide isomerase/thioredoxin
MKVLNNTKEFYEAVEQEKKVLVYFYTKWCPDCFVINPHIPRLEKEYPDIEFYKMDRDIDIALARHLNIFGIPSFLIFESGDELGSLVNKKRKSYNEVKEFIDTTIK